MFGFERTKLQWWGQFTKGYPDGTPNSCLMDAYSPNMVVTSLDPKGWKNNCRSSMNHQTSWKMWNRQSQNSHDLEMFYCGQDCEVIQDMNEPDWARWQ